jgi:hypothetical protein
MVSVDVAQIGDLMLLVCYFTSRIRESSGSRDDAPAKAILKVTILQL